MRVLLDTNVILDFFLEREPFYEQASLIFEAIADERLYGFVSASSVTDIFYLCRRQTQSFEKARGIIMTLLKLSDVCPVTRSALDAALNSGMRDFEDAVQVACAEKQKLEAIVTRNENDFRSSQVDVFTPEQLLQLL